MSAFLRTLLICFATAALAGCDTMDSAFGARWGSDPSDPITTVGSLAAAPITAAEHNAKGRENLRTGLYGLAETEFRASIEITPRNPEAWLGLAAAYDNLRRFDLADRAYKQVRRLLGPTAEVLNNEGYSYLMRGNLKKARQLFERAHKMDPGNPVINRNLDQINTAQAMNLPVGQ
ncbi:MAG: tetratricopeptide repeat protein [Pseudomonadota bacterium]